MKAVVSFFAAIAFAVWIIPLGVFIKPSQEKTACDGQRAFCMCMGKILKNSPVMGYGLKAGSGVNKEASAHHAGSSSFINLYYKHPGMAALVFLQQETILSFQYPFLRPVDHVPKMG